MATEYSILKHSEPGFPKLLKEIQSCPQYLYIRGNIDPDEPCIAVVGSRKPTIYGKEMAQYFAGELARAGVTVVSGLAFGIDTVAHEAALKAGGRTLAVLGTGINTIYPAANERLAEKIVDQGALISEFDPDEPSYPGNFPRRNRLVSGLSLGVLVVEAGEKSGALITASFAANQSRDVYAIPGPLNAPLSRGTNLLIQEGAQLVITPDDILEELRSRELPLFHGQQLKESSSVREKARSATNLDKTSQALLQLLSEKGIMEVDMMAAETKIAIAKLQTALTMLELKRLIKRMEDGTYTLVGR